MGEVGTVSSFCLGRWKSSGDGGCTVMWICLMPLNCTVKHSENGKFYVMYILLQ